MPIVFQQTTKTRCLTNTANERAKEENRMVVTNKDVYAALADLDFGDMLATVQELSLIHI